MTLALIPHAQLNSHGGFGRPHLVAARDGLVAFAGAFDRLYWSGRAIYDGHRPAERVVIYEGAARIAAFDDARFAINDLAFHPREPLLALATGQYDGGFFFEGDLLVWNWATGHVVSLLAESRTVLRVRWESDGRLVALLRPPDDDANEPGDTVRIVLDRMTPVAIPADLPITRESELEPRAPGVLDAELDARGLRPGGTIWDLAFANGVLAAACADGRVELWESGQRTVARFLGTPLQLIQQRGALLVNVQERHGTALRRLDGTLWRGFHTGRACSVDAAGRVLARNAGPERAPDEVLGDDGTVLMSDELGRYDAFNHFVRIDGADALYFLRGTPASQHLKKRLCAIDPDGRVYERMIWDPEDRHLMTSSAVLVEDGVVRAYRVYDPRGGGELWIERHGFDGDVAWRHRVRGAAASLVAWPAAAAIAFALVDGTFGVLDAATGAVLHEERFELDGLPTIVTALAIHDAAIALGTIDGRIALFGLR